VNKRRGILYCSHPDYHGMGPWHDWVMVMFAINGNCVISQLIREKHCENTVSSLMNIHAKKLYNLVKKMIMKMIPFCIRWEKETGQVVEGRT